MSTHPAADQGPQSSASTDDQSLVAVSLLSSLSADLPRHAYRGRKPPPAPFSTIPLESIEPIASEASDKPGTSDYMTPEEFKKVTETRQDEIRRTIAGLKEASKVCTITSS